MLAARRRARRRPRAVAEAVADELLRARGPVPLDSARAPAGRDVGISLFPGDAAGAADLLKHADAAMYQAKRAGRGATRSTARTADGAQRRLELTTRLRTRSSRGELELHYQPVYDLRGRARRRRGAAALERPGARHGVAGRVHPAGGGHGPDRADRRVGAQESPAGSARVAGPRPRARSSATTPPRASSCRPGFARRFGERLAAHGVRPGSLASRSSSRRSWTRRPSRPCSSALGALGVRVAIDDFGAGFSSLTRLRDLTVHTLKLDRAFLTTCPRTCARRVHHRHARARRASSASHVVTEGIETRAARFLLSEGCPLGQGYHLAPADAGRRAHPAARRSGRRRARRADPAAAARSGSSAYRAAGTRASPSRRSRPPASLPCPAAIRTAYTPARNANRPTRRA